MVISGFDRKLMLKFVLPKPRHVTRKHTKEEQVIDKSVQTQEKQCEEKGNMEENLPGKAITKL